MNDVNFKIKGHSGCFLNIIKDNNKMLVEKGCVPDYVSRLKKQELKQHVAYKNIANGIYKNINVPKSTFVDGKIIMDYIYSLSFIKFFEIASIYDIKNIVNILISFIDDELKNSKIQTIDKNIFYNKLTSILIACKKNELVDINKVTEYVNICKSKILEFDTIILPIGSCHGDLTFSNILFSNNDVYLIDFLDSFIETPLQDIVKLRQDTAYKWSLMMCNEQYNKSHIFTVLNYIDEQICSHFKKNIFYKYYNILQYINILRILPYVKEQQVYIELCKILDAIKL